MPKELTVQSVCRIAKDEKEVRQLLTVIWVAPEKGLETVTKATGKNKNVYEFEKTLEI